MIDTMLIDKAVEKSSKIEIIDYSWRDYLKTIQKSMFRLPFPGEYKALVDHNNLLVEGYHGHLIIDKLYYDKKTYLLKHPIEEKSFRIYGMYDREARFVNFTARPQIGFHYLGMNSTGNMSICTGDIKYAYPDTLDLLQKACLKIAESFKLINMHSLGKIFISDEYSKLKEIFFKQESNMEIKFKNLLSNNLIQKIL